MILDLIYNRDHLPTVVLLQQGSVTWAKPRSLTPPYFLVKATQKNKETLEQLKGKLVTSYTVVTKFHPIRRQEVKLYKVHIRKPADVIKARKHFDAKERWEDDIQYLLRVSADHNIAYGLDSQDKGLPFEQKLAKEVEWPDDVIAFDIEVLNDNPTQFPKAYTDASDLRASYSDLQFARRLLKESDVATNKVLSVSLAYKKDGKTRVELFMLRRWNRTPTLTQYFNGVREGKEARCKPGKYKAGEIEYLVRCFDDEKKLLQAVWTALTTKRFWVTYNGAAFDVPYLFYRSIRLGVTPPMLVPVETATEGDRGIVLAYPEHGVHVDLYLWFSKPAIKNYAHGSKYSDNSLDEVAKGVLGIGKHPLPPDVLPSGLDFEELAEYSATDAYLTLRLFEHDWPLITMMMRATGLGLSQLLTSGISRWVFSIILRAHVAENWLLPRKDELPAQIKTRDLSATGKGYAGAYVHEPPVGVFFDVVDLDVASLYPTMIVQYNLSYETVDNPYVLTSCKNKVYIHHPKTGEVLHTVCLDERGIVPEVLRDIVQTRLKYKRQGNKVVSNALKVLINSVYGVFGQENFRLFSGVAECVTLKGRETILSLIRYSQEHEHVPVLYADTDSLFLWAPPEEVVQRVVQKAKELKVELELDKRFRFVVFTGLKKNYLGVTTEGEVVVKGLLGKKSNVPEVVQRAFNEFVDHLAKCTDPECIARSVQLLRELRNKFSKEVASVDNILSFAISQTLSKPLSQYKTNAVHVKVARRLEKYGIKVGAGTKVHYVYAATGPIPLVEAYMLHQNGKLRLDSKKYLDIFDSVFSQLSNVFGSPAVSHVSLDNFLKPGKSQPSGSSTKGESKKLHVLKLRGGNVLRVPIPNAILLNVKPLVVFSGRRVYWLPEGDQVPHSEEVLWAGVGIDGKPVYVREEGDKLVYGVIDVRAKKLVPKFRTVVYGIPVLVTPNEVYTVSAGTLTRITKNSARFLKRASHQGVSVNCKGKALYVGNGSAVFLAKGKVFAVEAEKAGWLGDKIWVTSDGKTYIINPATLKMQPAEFLIDSSSGDGVYTLSGNKLLKGGKAIRAGVQAACVAGCKHHYAVWKTGDEVIVQQLDDKKRWEDRVAGDFKCFGKYVAVWSGANTMFYL